MDNNNGLTGLALGSWLVAFAAGTLVAILLWVVGGWSFLPGAIVGFLVFVIFGGIVSWIMTRPLPGSDEGTIDTPAAPSADISKTSAPAPQATAPSEPAAAPSEPAPAASAPAAAVASTVPASAEAPAVTKTEAKPAPKKAPAKKAPAKKAPATAASADARPALMKDAPDGGQADDLKKISGVGPKLEQTLNDLGIWHYEQVAKLTKKDIAWVDQRLRFKGRIERDDWVGQAKELAKAKG